MDFKEGRAAEFCDMFTVLLPEELLAAGIELTEEAIRLRRQSGQARAVELRTTHCRQDEATTHRLHKQDRRTEGTRAGRESITRKDPRSEEDRETMGETRWGMEMRIQQ